MAGIRCRYAVLWLLLLISCSPAGPPNPLGWQWQGRAVVCGKTISFAATDAQELPQFDPSQRHGYCARVVTYLALHREFGEQTQFFGVTAMTVAGLATLDVGAQRRAYSTQSWAFLSNLSRALEARALVVADDLRGSVKVGGALDRKLLQEEQAVVQAQLDALARKQPQAHARLVREVGQTLNPTDPVLLAVINSQPFFATYLAAIANVCAETGAPVRFDLQDQRVRVGMQLARLFRRF